MEVLIPMVEDAVLFQQGGILRRAGDNDASLAKHREMNVSPDDRYLYLVHSHSTALTLANLDDTRPAFEELRQGLDTARGNPDRADLGNLIFYFELAAEFGEQIPAHIQRLARGVVRLCGIDISDAAANDTAALKTALVAAKMAVQKGGD